MTPINKLFDQNRLLLTRHSNKKMAKALSLEWLGQTAASVCWIVSVFVYGISSGGDWLQLAAGSAWLMANVSAIVAMEPKVKS